MNIRTFVAILSRNPQYDFPRGVKGRLELFRSFIRFGVPIRPLVLSVGHWVGNSFKLWAIVTHIVWSPRLAWCQSGLLDIMNRDAKADLISTDAKLAPKIITNMLNSHEAEGCHQNSFSEKLGLLAQQGGGGACQKPKFLLKFSKTKFALVNG